MAEQQRVIHVAYIVKHQDGTVVWKDYSVNEKGIYRLSQKETIRGRLFRAENQQKLVADLVIVSLQYLDV